MKLVFWRVVVLDMLYVVVNIYVEVLCFVVDIFNYDFGVSVIVVFGVFNVKFIFKYWSYINGDDCGC